MIFSYKITKYKPNNEELNSTWTSFSDVGKLVSLAEYKSIEKEYINTVINISKCLNLKYLKVKELEFYIEPCEYFENQKIEIPELNFIIKLILRENLWCKLISDKYEFHFGYDYYMYFISYKKCLECVKKGVISNKLYVENFRSPYLVTT